MIHQGRLRKTPPMSYLDCNGLQLFYYEAGPDSTEAHTIIFVHGTQGNAALWAPAIDALCGRYRCAALNHRGRPPSDCPDDPDAYRIEQFADDQAVFIEQRGYERFTMIGWSLGVRTTLAYLQRHGQERAAQAILVGGPPSPNFGGQPLTPPRYDGSGLRRVWNETFAPITPACWQGSQRSRETCDLEAFLPELAIPVAILHGRNDPIAPHAAAEFMAARIPNAELHTFEASGHAPMISEPQRFLDQTSGFIQRCFTTRG